MKPQSQPQPPPDPNPQAEPERNSATLLIVAAAFQVSLVGLQYSGQFYDVDGIDAGASRYDPYAAGGASWLPWWAVFGEFAPAQYNGLVSCMVWLYIFTSSIVLVNLLIALFSDTVRGGGGRVVLLETVVGGECWCWYCWPDGAAFGSDGAAFGSDGAAFDDDGEDDDDDDDDDAAISDTAAPPVAGRWLA